VHLTVPNLFIFARSLFDSAHHKKSLKLWTFPKLKFSLPRKIYNRQRLWDKSVVLLGTSWVTYWELEEHIENTLRILANHMEPENPQKF